MSAEHILFLRLEGPLQSWGDRARWSVRDTRRLPTKSSLVGLLGCVSGYGPEAEDKLLDLARVLRVGVRADRLGTVIRDYHTVEGGVLSAEGKAKGKIKLNAKTGGPETVTSEREYLADACFAVALVGPPACLALLAERLAAPVWSPFLGRKSCPPSAPLWPAWPNSQQESDPRPLEADPEALAHHLAQCPWLGDPGRQRDRDDRSIDGRLLIEWEPPQGHQPKRGTLSWRHDQPQRIRPRAFGVRPVVIDACPCPDPPEGAD